MNWKDKYLNLISKCEKEGLTVEEKGYNTLRDYAGMNPQAAKDFGFKMPANTIYIDKDLDWKTKYNTLKHEFVELNLMNRNDNYKYWNAHKKALRAEE